MARLEDADLDALHRAYRWAYLAGLTLCVFWPLMLQLAFTEFIAPGQNPPDGVVKQLGYTFTGLVLLCAAFVTWRSGKVRAGFCALAAAARPRAMAREILLYSALFEVSCFFGLAYWALAGHEGVRFARSFIVLTSIMFFCFVPRFDAWRRAAEGEA
ncbi:MAG: hypothetical protein IPQ13_14500 [Holophagaceae bacterium]|nr:hypothetical protein [Holophagaceae bacterium]